MSARAATVLTLAALVISVPSAHANPTIPGSVSGDTDIAYLPMTFDSTVEAVNLRTRQVEKAFHVAPGALVIKETLDHRKLYVSNFGIDFGSVVRPGPHVASEVSVIDKAAGTVRSIPTIGPPYAVLQLSYDGRYLYVPTALSVIQVIDTQTDAVVRTLPIALPPFPAHLEISPDDSTLYVMSGAGTITKYDAVTGQVIGLPLFTNGLLPGWGALSTDGKRLYAVNLFGAVVMVDVDSWTLGPQFKSSVTDGALSATLTPDSADLWVCNRTAGTIEIFDAVTARKKGEVRTNGGPAYAGFSADGAKAYVSVGDSGLIGPGYLDVYDAHTLTLDYRIPVGRGPVAGVYPV